MAKPWKVRGLDPDETLAVSLEKILRTKFREMLSHVPATLKGDDIEALHDLRISTRRIESTLKVFKRCFPKEIFKQEYQTIKEFLRIMGGVREQDVFMQTLRQFSSSLPEGERAPIDSMIEEHQIRYTELREELNTTLGKLSNKEYRARFEGFLKTLQKQ